jgi:hypothetical protein
MLDLAKVALRLDDEEKLKVRYRFPQRTNGETTWMVRCSKLLDVEQEGGRLFVSQDGSVVWIDLSEAIEILSDDGIYD